MVRMICGKKRCSLCLALSQQADYMLFAFPKEADVLPDLRGNKPYLYIISPAIHLASLFPLISESV